MILQARASLEVEGGDVLSHVNGESLTQFVGLDAVLHNNVGKPFSMTTHLAGRKLNVELNLGDLHAITPNEFGPSADTSFHALSY